MCKSRPAEAAQRAPAPGSAACRNRPAWRASAWQVSTATYQWRPPQKRVREGGGGVARRGAVDALASPPPRATNAATALASTSYSNASRVARDGGRGGRASRGGAPGGAATQGAAPARAAANRGEQCSGRSAAPSTALASGGAAGVAAASQAAAAAAAEFSHAAAVAGVDSSAAAPARGSADQAAARAGSSRVTSMSRPR